MLSVALLIGFYVLAIGLVVAVGAFGLGYGTDWDGSGTRTFRPFVVGAAIALLLGLLFAFGRVLTQRPSPPAGVRLTPERAPDLWALVRDLADRVDTREPDEIRLVRMMIVETVRHTTDGVLRAVLSAYARLYIFVEQAISRQMEYEADRAVAAAGRGAMVSALREIRVVAAGWDDYLERHVAPAYDRGHLPEDLFGGFATYLTECREEIRARSIEVAPQEPAWRDSHPPIADRIAALRFVSDVAVVTDGRPATVLLPDLDAAGRQLRAGLFDRAGIRLLPWDRLTPTLADQSARGLAHPLYQAANRLTDRADADLELLHDLFAADRYADLARELTLDADGDEGLLALTAAFEGAVEAAAVDSGAAAWRHSWTGPPELLTTAGDPLPLGEMVELAADPVTVPAARARLAASG
ncbi:M48 family metalloprotease [Micromonospora sp. PPF5-17]|uniref:Peptidase M48 domain-containing protein n=1 Tax=Micromonospora solifontis TaxID=2487138 RepID=A0ABX9WCX6_9ACTN|nr:M48 family metalloprotease [Micromonospora solifontis]NES39299.1 M48 family metalloprotease [Micromonospora solifontis]RNL89594.1 hypothetical protein EFE23_24735 [Micromonospora solifontis]